MHGADGRIKPDCYGNRLAASFAPALYKMGANKTGFGKMDSYRYGLSGKKVKKTDVRKGTRTAVSRIKLRKFNIWMPDNACYAACDHSLLVSVSGSRARAPDR